jgi:predicted nucleic acid-binding Zn ribbon protein
MANTRERRPFSAEELEDMRALYAQAQAEQRPPRLVEFCRKYGRHRQHIARKARRLGIQFRPVHGKAKITEARQRQQAEARKRERMRKAEAPRKKAEAEAAWKISPLGSLLYAAKRHDIAVRASRASRRKWMSLSDAERKEWTEKQKQALLSRYGRGATNRPARRRERAHTRGVGGIREDLGIYMRSTWEANWARYLRLGIAQGSVKAWEYEPVTFTFPDGADPHVRSYTPDFRVCMPDGSTVYHEVKGWMTDRARRALELMRQFHPEVVVQVFSRRAYQQLTQRWRDSIPEWEHCPAATRQRLARERSKRRMRTCKQCGNQIGVPHRRSYCSDECSKRAACIAHCEKQRAATSARRPKHGECVRCGVAFTIRPMGRVRRFCSNRCGVATYRETHRATV